jgi:hypothetical protein
MTVVSDSGLSHLVISQTATVKDATETTIDGGLSGMMVIDTATSIEVSSNELNKVVW